MNVSVTDSSGNRLHFGTVTYAASTASTNVLAPRDEGRLWRQLRMDRSKVYHLKVMVTVDEAEVGSCPRRREEKQDKNLWEGLSNKKFSDLILKCGDNEFPCHKIVLASQSPVFEAMFSHGFSEEKTNQVDIKDEKRDTVENMVKFLYK